MQHTNHLFDCFPFENDKNYNKLHQNSDSFMTKKLSRFIFPTRDIVDPSWITTTVPPFEALNHLINLSWTRLSEGEIKVWNEMCGRRVQDKEVSTLGLYKTEHDLRKDRGDYKREMQRIIYINNKKADNNIKAKELILSQNKIIQSSDKDVSQLNLLQIFKNDKEEIASFILECLKFKFSKATKKILRNFQAQLFSPQMSIYIYFYPYHIQ